MFILISKTFFFFAILVLSSDAYGQTWDADPLFGNHSIKWSYANNKDTSENAKIVGAFSISAKDPFWADLPSFVQPKGENEIARRDISTLINDAKSNGTLDHSAIKKLLSSNPEQLEDLLCTYLDSVDLKTASPETRALHYTHCDEEGSKTIRVKGKTMPISNADQYRRAERFYYKVRFKDAAKALDQLDSDSLTKTLFCQSTFLRGRTLYRIKVRRKESEKAYQNIIEKCTEKAFLSLKKRSLYAWGKRRFALKDLKKSKSLFSKLYKEFSDTSYGDDALLYLARIAAQEGKRKEEKKWVLNALSDYPEGDMISEIAWEYCEPLYKQKKYNAFIKRLASLHLPKHDSNYLSQGRLLYFNAQALLKTKSKEKGIEQFKKAWDQYPFSFYGYLSYLRLKALKVDAALPERNAERPAFLEDPRWKKSLLHYAFENNLVNLSKVLTQNMELKEPDDYWRKAYLQDKMKNYPQSHNIIRRKIKGRPWIYPVRGRDERVRLAWPRPFKEAIDQAIEAEQKQHPKTFLLAAFPSSIMREESSFIEDIESWAGALGLMQLMPRTAQGYDDDIEGGATVENLKRAKVNIRVGVDHLSWLSRKTDGHPALMAAAYNAGLGAVNRWLKAQPNEDIALWVEDIPYFEARNYTKRVIGSYAAYQWIYGVKALDPRLGRAAKK